MDTIESRGRHGTWITIVFQDAPLREIILHRQRTTLGRRPGNDVVLEDLAVSGEHAALVQQGGAVYIEDLQSTNGTYINGKAIRKQLLYHEDKIEIGKCRIQFFQVNPSVDSVLPQNTLHPSFEGLRQPSPSDQVCVPAPDDALAAEEADAINDAGSVISPPFSRDTEPSDLPAPSAPMGDEGAEVSQTQNSAPVKQAMAAVTGRLQVLSGPSAGREVSLQKVVTTLGKPGVAVVAITRRPHEFLLNHVEGAPLASLNGQAVGEDPMLLRNGDVLELAGTRMQFVQA